MDKKVLLVGGATIPASAICLILKKTDSQFSLDVTVRSFKILLHNGIILEASQDIKSEKLSEMQEIDLLYNIIQDLLCYDVNYTSTNADFDNVSIKIKNKGY